MDQSRYIRDVNSFQWNRTGENRDWRKNDFSSNTRRVIEDHKYQNESQKRLMWSVLSFFFVFLILVIFVTCLLYIPDIEDTVCVPGFSGVNCERSDFLGTYLWSASEYYTLDDKMQHRNGIAFRVYAPNAEHVKVLVKPESGIEREYNMKQQKNGYWFANIGSIGLHSEYVYLITNHDNFTRNHLLQGGKEAIITSRGWRNREPDDSILSHTQPTFPYSSDITDEVIYTLHIPSFSYDLSTGYGTFQSALSFIPYLKELGVTIIRILDISPQTCVNQTIHVQCWYHSHVVYPDVIQPLLGSQQQLKRLIDRIHQYGMRVIIDIDWTGFDNQSNFFNYDESNQPTSYGPLFQNTTIYSYNGHEGRNIDLSIDHAGYKVLEDVLYRYSYTYQFDGIYWKGMLCFRLNHIHCENGFGEENIINTDFLLNVKSIANTVDLWFGEDDDNIITLESSNNRIVNIVNSQENRGLEFNGKRDLSIMRDLKSFYLTNNIVNSTQIQSFILSWNTLPLQNIISLESLESIYRLRLITEAQPFYDSFNLYHMLLQLHFLLYATPGIVSLYQGSEYLESSSMADIPKSLNITNEVGIFKEGKWDYKGESYWFYQYTHDCLIHRYDYGFSHSIQITPFYHDIKLGILVFEMETKKGYRLLILYTQSRPLIEESYKILLPAPFDEMTIWENEFTTDDPKYVAGSELVDDPIPVFPCENNERSKWCGNIHLGPFSTRILFPIASQSS